MIAKHLLGDDASDIVDVADRPEEGAAAGPPIPEGTWKAYTDKELFEMTDTPPEIAIHYAMSEIYDNPNVPTFRTAARRAGGTESRWIVYMDYAPFGTLDVIIEEYGKTRYGQIPEPFIWYVAESLASACKTLIWGDEPSSDLDSVHASDISVSSNDDQAGDGNQKVKGSDDPPLRYVHTDIKPENILLGEAQTAYYPVYKHPLLADLGDLATSGGRHKLDTPGYLAPEVEVALPVSGKTMVWEIGIILYSLTRRVAGIKAQNALDREAPTELDETIPVEDLLEKPSINNESYKYLYSKRLEDLIIDCLQTHKRGRPTIARLHDKAREGLDLINQTQKLLDADVDTVPQFLRINFKPDQYPIASKRKRRKPTIS
ncbi:uncharacterized protein BDZ99DRAFT_28017 [Mytilinidion resinicola]|uniref:non-specific serine/threonine protein kinase n=1 Tax=Mytilinidion resinicola TaxID=574789 RepID=A0A6A6YKI6_9PEZI|nr:uncharacterized protein BDZ99DRAFT_28017 [Mytilinidion resinicola]KAF2809382.1 hypothetical protein BDZ99DRAFT_28017 [Mytilinidion resinicola]